MLNDSCKVAIEHESGLLSLRPEAKRNHWVATQSRTIVLAAELRPSSFTPTNAPASAGSVVPSTSPETSMVVGRFRWCGTARPRRSSRRRSRSGPSSGGTRCSSSPPRVRREALARRGAFAHLGDRDVHVVGRRRRRLAEQLRAHELAAQHGRRLVGCACTDRNAACVRMPERACESGSWATAGPPLGALTP